MRSQGWESQFYLVVDDNVVLCSHVISNVMIHDEAEEPVEERQIYLLIELLELSLEHHVTLPIRSFPDVLEVVDTLAPLVH